MYSGCVESKEYLPHDHIPAQSQQKGYLNNIHKNYFNIFVVDFEQVVTRKVVFKREHIFIFCITC